MYIWDPLFYPLDNFTFDDANSNKEKDDNHWHLFKPTAADVKFQHRKNGVGVTMPSLFTTKKDFGERFYEEVTTRKSDDGVGWTVMLDHRTLKIPSESPLKLPTLALAKAIAAEWDYQQRDGIRPFTMPLTKMAFTALETVPRNRFDVIYDLSSNLHSDSVFYGVPEDMTLTVDHVCARHVEKAVPLLAWLNSEFGFKPVVSYEKWLRGPNQGEGLTEAVRELLKKTDNFELAAIDFLVSPGDSVVTALGIFRGKLQIEEAIELITVQKDFKDYTIFKRPPQWRVKDLCRDDDIRFADVQTAGMKAQISSAIVFLGLSRKNIFD